MNWPRCHRTPSSLQKTPLCACERVRGNRADKELGITLKVVLPIETPRGPRRHSESCRPAVLSGWHRDVNCLKNHFYHENETLSVLCANRNFTKCNRCQFHKNFSKDMRNSVVVDRETALQSFTVRHIGFMASTGTDDLRLPHGLCSVSSTGTPACLGKLIPFNKCSVQEGPAREAVYLVVRSADSGPGHSGCKSWLGPSPGDVGWVT